LAVVLGIVEVHDARIRVESEPGNGATFRICFPAVDAAVLPLVEKEAVPFLEDGGDSLVLQGEGKRILYIDDDESIVYLMERLLQRRGYRFCGYTDSQKALEAVRADPAAFDLVITDYNMPGMSGLEVARALREIRADLPVAIASGYLTEELRAKAPAAGVTELIYKPNTVDDFCDAVARLASTTK
jgi:CheY-like chemotaxis protein